MIIDAARTDAATNCGLSDTVQLSTGTSLALRVILPCMVRIFGHSFFWKENAGQARSNFQFNQYCIGSATNSAARSPFQRFRRARSASSIKPARRRVPDRVPDAAPSRPTIMNKPAVIDQVFVVARYGRADSSADRYRVRHDIFLQRDIAWEVGTQQRSDWLLNRARNIRNDMRAAPARSARQIAAADARREALPAARREEPYSNHSGARATSFRMPAVAAGCRRRTRYSQPIQAPSGG
jgi:hypothetical protein